MTIVRGPAFAVRTSAKSLKGFLKWLIAVVGSTRGYLRRVRISYEILIARLNVDYQKADLSVF